MNKPVVRCRCGHQILAKEVLRTDLYERRAPEGNTREFVYVKYRCQHCKRIGEAFVPESRWDRSILEPERSELTDAEREHFQDAIPISSEEILDFHRELASIGLFTSPAPEKPPADEVSTQPVAEVGETPESAEVNNEGVERADAKSTDAKSVENKADKKNDKKDQPRRLFRRDS